MIKKLFLILLVIGMLGLVGVSAVFYKTDLSRDELPEYVTSASKFIELPNGANMHYRDEGNLDGQVLVMVHGGFGSLQNWEGWVENLKDDFRLVSMDLLGHGLTGAYPEHIYTRLAERDAVHMLLEKLNIKRYTISGNSFGGGIALEIALEYPNEVEGLILVDSEGIPNGEDGYDTSMFNDDPPVSPNDPAYTELSLLESIGKNFIGPAVVKSVMEQMTYDKNLLTDEYVRYFSRQIRHAGNREAQLLMFRQGIHLVQQNGKQDLLPRLSELHMPTLVMQGAQDTLVPMRVAETFRDNITNSRLAVIDNAGHMPMMEKPKESAIFVRQFLQSDQLKHENSMRNN